MSFGISRLHASVDGKINFEADNTSVLAKRKKRHLDQGHRHREGVRGSNHSNYVLQCGKYTCIDFILTFKIGLCKNSKSFNWLVEKL